MARVFGVVRDENDRPVFEATVRAFDKDMRSEQRLGEAVTSDAGRYVIEYTEAQYRRAEKKQADLIVRAFDEAGNLRAESDIIFNARDEERIDLTFAPLPPPPGRDLSELEALQEAIEPVREQVEPAEFTAQDIRFLVEELVRRRTSAFLEQRERRQLQQRLEFLRQSDHFNGQTDIQLAAFYGWFRIFDNQLLELDALLDLPPDRLRRALQQAIAENIIPNISDQFPGIFERLRVLRFQQGRIVSHRFVGRLLDAETDRPLGGHLIDVMDLDTEAEEQQSLGVVPTDGRGVFVLTFILSGTASADAVRHLRLTVRDDDRTVAETEIEAPAHQEEIAEIRVRVRQDERGQVAIDAFAPADLVARLRQRGIRTLGELLDNPDVSDDENPEGVERLRAHARIAVTTELDAEQRDALIDRGHHRLLDVARTPRATFVGRNHEPLGGDAAAYITREAAVAYSQLVRHMGASAWLQVNTTPDDEPDDPDIPTGVQETLKGLRKCGCKDCESAVSPAAYLAHLLDWTLEHLRDGDNSIGLRDLEEDLHQPFRDLPASCEAVEEQVRQVRICVEVLWSFTGLRDLAELQMPTPFRAGYRFLRNQLYRAILANLGLSYDRLRLAQLHQGSSLPADGPVAQQRETVADLLGIDPSHLADLFFDIEQPPISPSEAELGEIFGYEPTNRENPFAPLGRPALITWQRQRLEAIWQQQDWPTDAYSGEARLPFVDPAIIDASYLRTIEPNPALDLLLARQEALTTHRQNLVDSAPQPDAEALVTLLTNELGRPIAVLREQYDTLQAADVPEQIAQVHADIAALGLTPAGFTHLMEIDARLQNGAPIAPTVEAVATAWDIVFDILSRAFRHSRFADWVDEEDSVSLILGPELFWLPTTPAPPPDPWQASVAERLAWEEALRLRSRPPVIDPDQIGQVYLKAFRLINAPFRPGFPPSLLPQLLEMPPLVTYERWQERREWVNGRMEVLQAAREGQPTGLEALQAILETSLLGVGSELFAELATLEAAGSDLQPRLAQLNLTMPECRFLANIHQLAQGEAPIAAHEWRQVAAILVQAEKRRAFAAWRLKEQDDEIFLLPLHFNLLKEPPEQDDDPARRWLHDALAHEQWEATLRARYEQFDTLDAALASAVGEAEAQVLPLLRNLLIMHSIAPGNSLAEKADWLDKRLLIDPYMDGCHMTTRVSQVIETLQRLIRGIYTQEHPAEAFQHLELDSIEDYEAEWPVLGSYATWRAFMLAYLYPENLLHVSSPDGQSFGFTQLKLDLPIQVLPDRACEAATAYADYYRDICHLEVQASCQAVTRLSRVADCDPTSSTDQVWVHLFALATTSGKVYTAAFSPASAKDLLTSWHPINKAGAVEQTIGAVAHTTPYHERLLLLFFKVHEPGSYKLKYVKYDLDELRWYGPTALELPPTISGNFTAAVIQKRDTPFREDDTNFYSASSFPTIVAVQSRTGIIYLRELASDADGWSSEGWFPLSGSHAAKKAGQLKALVQVDDKTYVIFSQAPSPEDGIRYRPKSLNEKDPQRGLDDLEWRTLHGFGSFQGAVTKPFSKDVFVFFYEVASTQYRLLDIKQPLIAPLVFNESRYRYRIGSGLNTIKEWEAIEKFDEEWLKGLVGVSLADFKFSPRLKPKIKVPKNDPGTRDPTVPSLSDGSVELLDDYGFDGFRGTLLDLLTLSDPDFEFVIPEEAHFQEHDKGYYLAQLQIAGVERFKQELENITEAGYLDEGLGKWKLADHYIRLLSEGHLSLVGLVEEIRKNVTSFWMEQGEGAVLDEIKFADRDTLGDETPLPEGDETLLPEQVLSSDLWLFSPSGGDGKRQSPYKAVAISQPDGAFVTRLRWEGDTVSLGKTYRVTPRGNGPFNLVPLAAQKDLQLRSQEIQEMYVGPPGLLGSPASVMVYLKEAYNLVPMYLGYALQRSGFYEEALLWYRQVFDYLQPFGQRRIDYSLRHEETLAYEYDAQEWLDDASNPHAIAATRKNTYTRHALLMIIRCLIDYADALFSRDNVTDNTRARELYTQALRLLDLRLLKPGKSPCSDIIGELEVEVVEPGHLPLDQFKVALTQLHDPDRLAAVVKSLQAISRDTARSQVERLATMRQTVLTALAELPAPKPVGTVRADTREMYRTLENLYLTHRPARELLQKGFEQRHQSRLSTLALVTDMSEDALLRERPSLPWLHRQRSDVPDDGTGPNTLNLALLDPITPPRLAVLRQIRKVLPLQSLMVERRSSFAVTSGLTFDFCIPQNPVITALRTRAENNLAKLRQCRNIAGMERQLAPYGAPIGIGSGMVSPDGRIFSGIVEAPPTPYRYAALIARAKELVGLAQQIEAGYLTALERAEDVALTLLQAEQSIETAAARVALQDLRVTQANNELGLAQLHKNSAVLREETYAGWIAAGNNEHEKNMLQAHEDARDAQIQANRWRATGQAAQAAIAATQLPSGVGDKVNPGEWAAYAVRAALAATATAAAIAEGVYNERAIEAQSKAQISSLGASFERRQEEWQLQQGLAALDVQIGDQQIMLAEGQINIAQQERAIAGLEQTHAADVLEFLRNKDFTEEMYRWIASVLEDVYRFFLQVATATARLAQAQLAFERQEGQLKAIQPNYWNVPADSSDTTRTGNNGDRLGLTGSARLLKDIYQLDQYAFGTRRRKQALTVTLDLAQLFPFEFQRFRETGVLIFETPQSLIDRQFPGYYLCLIQQVSVSVVALVPPTYGIRASLTSAGTSRVVVGGDIFQVITIRNLPERLALTAPVTSSASMLDLEPDAQSLLRPFEGSGFDTLWELRMPKANNLFNYNTMATVLFTVEFTALHSFDYERQVIERLDRRVSANRAFHFREEFADAWYDLHNPDQTNTPMTVRFETRREDFPPNLEQLRIEHVLLYFVGAGSEFDEITVTHFTFTEHQSAGAVGGGATSVDGVISTRRGNGTSWLPMIGAQPVGVWELALPDTSQTRARFVNEEIEEILLVITYGGKTPDWPR
jgi:hypothetical protein